MADYGQEIKKVGGDMGQSSDKAHKALDEILRLAQDSGVDTDKLRMQVGVARMALREIRTARNQLISWAEIAIERLHLAQQKGQ